ncbi:MAG: NAD-dependent epimerase/dehydratase family protein [Alphaproteobacteria bacterium]|nr:NAD-dependent epimerase/dehydratase family protein [Alphaproteobacteria bacterium]
MLQGATVVVVGAAGFVGANLCHRLLALGVRRLVAVDNLLSAEADNLSDDPRLSFLHGSITEDRLLARLPPADCVFHLATYHGNQSSMADPLADHDNNLLPTLKLCEHLKVAPGLHKLVYASAGCTVAEKTFAAADATREDDPVSLYLDSPYQISKIVGEFYGNYYFMRHKLPFVKARFQNVYGPREVLGAGRWRGTPASVWRNVTPTFIWKALAGEALPVENGGIATRDFIYVDDLVDGLVACAERGEPGEVYNLASGVETTILQLAETVNRLTGNKTPIRLAPARNWDRSGKRYGDPAKAAERLGFRAGTPLEDGLARTIEWTRANAAWIGHCIARHRRFLAEAER